MCLYYRKHLQISEETATLIFGVLASVFIVIAFFLCILILLGINGLLPQTQILEYNIDYMFSMPRRGQIELNIIYSILLIKALVDFGFAVLLCRGICKKIPRYLKTYFIYGVLMVLLDAVAVGLAFSVDVDCGRILLAFLIFYCLMLHLINITYQSMAAKQSEAHSRLIENITQFNVQTPQQTRLEACPEESVEKS